jgi:hypothetical protein
MGAIENMLINEWLEGKGTKIPTRFSSTCPVMLFDDRLMISYFELAGFLKGHPLSERLAEETSQLLPENWQAFKDTRALFIEQYTPQGVIVHGIDAQCAEPWDYLDTNEPMVDPDLDCVAFHGHGQLGWPRSFLRKFFEFHACNK